jgi:hypothetical protein
MDVRNLCRLLWLKQTQNVVDYSKKDITVNWHFIRSFSPKDCLILSYENRFFDDEAYTAFVRNHDFQVGRSEKCYRLVILRDAFNLFASLYNASFVTSTDITLCVEIFKQYAELFLNPTRQKALNITCVSFYEWFASPVYRIALARQFGVAISGEAFQSVPSIGGGSSFDGIRLDGCAQKMRVLERWKVCWGDPEYRTIFNDRRLVELSEAVFGRTGPDIW